MTETVRRILIAIAVLLVAALALGAAVVVIAVRRPLPDLGATQRVGVNDEVRIERDARGIPHIYATSDTDLFFGQGYVHAQDRFFEMDFRRRVTAGRLAELVGEAALDADIATRTMGWRTVAESEWGLLNRETQGFLQAYADGVNAYLRGREASELAIEYTVLGLQVKVENPEPWTPIDSLAWLKAMAWDLRGNYDDELGRVLAYQSVGEMSLVAQLYPNFGYDRHVPIVPGGSSPVAVSDPGWIVSNAALTDYEEALSSDAILSAQELLDAVPVLVGDGTGIGSNSFVVAGEHTDTGEPILANDPHLELGAPGIWYQVGLHCSENSASCTFDVGGFSFAGLPGVIIGHNSDLAWGLTNMGPDVTDFFLERVYQDGTYQYGEERLALEVRTETLEVNGGDPVTLEVRSTQHGPLMTKMLAESILGTPVPSGSPAAGSNGYEVALRWTALDPGTTIEAIFAVNRAADARDMAAAAALFEVPAQAMVYATTSGDIGFQAPGRVPRRAQVEGRVPSDGTWPRPGWDPAYDWQGFVPAADMPNLQNPDEGFIVAANQAVTEPEAGPILGVDFDPGYRSNRIRAILNGLIDGGDKISVDLANRIMMDSKNPAAEMVVPAIVRLNVEDPFLADAIEVLQDWRAERYPNSADSAGAAFFNMVWAHLVTGTFEDELGEASFGDARWIEVVRTLLASPDDPWWDDVTTVAVTETRDEILLQSLQEARAQLTRSLAKNPQSWQWGDLHQAAFEHPVLSPAAVPTYISWFFNPAAFPVSGGTASVNATNWAITAGETRPDFTMTSGPSMRMVADMSDLDSSTWVVTTGVSGHPASGNYKDQMGAWREGDTFPWPWTADAVKDASRATMVLTPAE